MSTQRTPWKKRLEPFGELYAAMEYAILNRLESMTDDELRKTLAATKCPTQTNVWSASYRVAPTLAEAISSEQYRRRRARAAAHRRAVAAPSSGVDGAR